MNELNKTFYAVTSIASWSKSDVRYLDGDRNMPYAERGGVWYYFGYDGGRKSYYLIATSRFDLAEVARERGGGEHGQG